MIALYHPTGIIDTIVDLPRSKSESNRALIIQSLNNGVSIKNLASSDDTRVLNVLLHTKEKELNVGAAGTAFRFLTAYLAISERQNIILTGSDRMKERPVGVLVDALRELGADIKYMGKEGYPPLMINGKKLTGGVLQIDATVSSQFITALMLIAPYLSKGLTINLSGQVASLPYIQMTASLQRQAGAKVSFDGKVIKVEPVQYKAVELDIEADWSSASYWFSISALSKSSRIELKGLRMESFQGDKVVKSIYEEFGVHSFFKDGILHIEKNTSSIHPTTFNFDFAECPDLAQTVIASMAALGMKGHLSGLHTLKIKETDRIMAMHNELIKMKVNSDITNQDFFLKGDHAKASIKPISTYHDHRIALSFAALALRHGMLIEDEQVISKSYPGFWDDLKAAGFNVKIN